MRTLILVAGIGLLLGSGYLNSRWSDQRFSPTVLEDATARMDAIPHVLGDWRGEDRPMEARVLKASGAQGMLRRNYVNEKTGASIDILVVCGRPGPVAVHPPEVCYEGNGNEVGEPSERAIELGQQTAQFKTMRVRTGVGTANP